MGASSATNHDCCSHAFMSLEDLASVVSKNKGVGLEMLRQLAPIVTGLVKSTRLYQSFLQLYETGRQHVMFMYMEKVWDRVSATMTASDDDNDDDGGERGEEHPRGSNETDSNETTLLDVGARRNSRRIRRDKNHDSRNNRTWQQASPAEVLMMRKFIRQHRRQIALFEMYANEIFHKFDASPHHGIMATHENAWVVNASEAAESDTESGASDVANASILGLGLDFGDQRNVSTTTALRRSRRLLSSSPSVVDSYSSLVASTKGFSNAAVATLQKKKKKTRDGTATPLITETWLQGPFGWPPRYALVFLRTINCMHACMLVVVIQRLFVGCFVCTGHNTASFWVRS